MLVFRELGGYRGDKDRPIVFRTGLQPPNVKFYAAVETKL